jgi:hypothetical protein
LSKPVDSESWFPALLGRIAARSAVYDLLARIVGVTETGSSLGYEETVRAARFIERNLRLHKPRFWYDNQIVTKPPARAIASTYFWGFSLVNENMPALTAEEAAALPRDALLVFLLPVGRTLEAALATLRQHGSEASIVAQNQFGTGESSVLIVLADLRRIAGDRELVRTR